MEDYRDRQPARVSEYIDTVPGTTLAILKIVDAVACLAALIGLAVLYFASLSNAQDILDYLQSLILQTEGLTEEMISHVSVFFTASGGLLMGLFTALCLYLAVMVLINLIEAVCSFKIRFSHRKALTVRLIQSLKCFFSVVLIFLIVGFSFVLIAGLASYRRSPEGEALVASLSGGVTLDQIVMALDIAVIIVAVILVIFEVLLFCYHRDVAAALDTVRFECETDCQDPAFRFTHLSGICLTLFILYLVGGFGQLAQLSQEQAQISQILMSMVSSLVLAVKYLCVLLSYSKMKKLHPRDVQE